MTFTSKIWPIWQVLLLLLLLALQQSQVPMGQFSFLIFLILVFFFFNLKKIQNNWPIYPTPCLCFLYLWVWGIRVYTYLYLVPYIEKSYGISLWFISLSIMPSRSIHVVANSKISFFLKLKKKKNDSLVAACGLGCPMACGILVPWPRVKPMFLALQDRFLTSGLPGKSLILFYAEQYSVMCVCV